MSVIKIKLNPIFMKFLHFIFPFIFLSSINAQELSSQKSNNQEEFLRFQVRDARENGDDISPQMLGRKSYLCIYTISESDQLHLSNLSETDDDQSYGLIYNISKEVHSETDKNLGSEIIKFNWSYNNNYDDIKGTGEVTIFVIHKNQGDYFELTIVAENLDKFVYKGELKGDLCVFDKFIETQK